jgi:monoamine oxidase
MDNTDVIIIGAGAAGLMAGRELQKKGINFVILEATDRAGGRALTKDGYPHIELGPEFLHGQTPVTDSLLEEFRLPWYDMEFDFHLYLHGKLSPLPDFWEEICEVMKDIDPGKKDVSFQDYLEQSDRHSPDVNKIARAFIQGFDAADLSEISSRALAGMKDQACDPQRRKMRRPLSGYGKLMEMLSDFFQQRFFFSHFVKEIEWKNGEVTVNGASGEGRVPFQVKGKKILLTASLGALKRIRLSPTPEPLRNFLEQTELGQVVKIVAELEPEFFHQFPDKTFPFIVAPDHCFTAWWTTTPIHTHLVTAWSGGEKARKLEGKTMEERQQIFLTELAEISGQCPTKISAWLRKCHSHDWGQDPSFLGAYSYPRVVRGERQKIETVFDETLYLAGEAYHEEFSGTVEGALLTGRDAAEKILSDFSEAENVDVGRPLREGRV